MSFPAIRLDCWEHINSTTDYGVGGGVRTTSAAAAQTSGTKRVILHRIIPMLGATGAITILKGDGTTNYFTTTFQIETPGASVPPFPIELNVELAQGLAISGLTAGSALIVYSLRS